MASLRWIGAALDVQQVDLITCANTFTAGDTATLTINSKSIIVTLGATVTVTAVATAIAEAINGETATGDATRSADGSDIPEFAELTATSDAGVVTVTANTAGRPFTLTASESTAGDGTVVRSASVACTGKNFWGNTANWDTGSLPIDADVVYFDNSSVSVLYDLDQSLIELAELYIALSFTGEIGLPEINAEGGYHEYRSQYLTIGPVILKIGAGAGNGSGRLKINSGADVAAVTVFNTGSSADELPAFMWKGTDAANTLTLVNGSVGVGVFGGEVATLATVTKSGGSLLTGSGVTLSGALVQSSGDWIINSLIDGSLTNSGGTAVVNGVGNVDQLTVSGGAVVLNTTGTLGGATVVSGTGVLDMTGAPVALAGVSAAIDVHGPTASVIDPLKRLGNAAFDLNFGATVAQLDLGNNLRVTRGATA